MITNKYIDVVFFDGGEQKVMRVYTNSDLDATNVVFRNFQDAIILDCVDGISNSYYNKGFSCLIENGVQKFKDGGEILEFSTISSLLNAINLNKIPSPAVVLVNDLKSNPDIELLTMDDPKIKILVEVLNKNYPNVFEEEVEHIEVSEDAKKIALEIKDLEDLLGLVDSVEDGKRIQNEINDLLAILEIEGVSYYTALTGKPISKKEIRYKLGDKYSDDFDDYGLFATALTADASWGVDKLRLLYDSFEDNNYHTASANLWDAIEKLESGDVNQAKDLLVDFKNDVKKQMKESGYY